MSFRDIDYKRLATANRPHVSLCVRRIFYCVKHLFYSHLVRCKLWLLLLIPCARMHCRSQKCGGRQGPAPLGWGMDDPLKHAPPPRVILQNKGTMPNRMNVGMCPKMLGPLGPRPFGWARDRHSRKTSLHTCITTPNLVVLGQTHYGDLP